MPVGDEENLRRRLHSLVTTGEDRAASLPEKLRQKRNEVRYRRTGLLPQAEQALEDGKRVVVGDDLLKTDGGNMQLWHGC